MSHLYTLLVGGHVIAGPNEPDASAVAWAADTILAVGSDADVQATSRGDSHEFDLAGAFVVPLEEGSDVRWPTSARLEIGGRADMAVLAMDPRTPGGTGVLAAIAVIRSGQVVRGSLPNPGVDIHASGHDASADAAR